MPNRSRSCAESMANGSRFRLADRRVGTGRLGRSLARNQRPQQAFRKGDLMNASVNRSKRTRGVVVIARLSVLLVISAVFAVGWPAAVHATERTFTVNSFGDGDDPFPGDGICDTDPTTPSPTGECTLRAALEEVNGLYQGYYHPADTDLQTVSVPAGTYYVYSELSVGGNVVVNGAGRDTTLITGQGNAVTSVGLSATAAINDLTITNGLAASAAGIFNSGDLTLTNVAVTNNTATTNSGGGIRNFGALTLDHVLMSGNQAEEKAGAIENVDGSGATLTVSDSTFYRNKSVDTTESHSGGAIYNGSGCTLNVKRSMFEGNSAPLGGAIYNDGTALITNVTFYNNKGTTTLTGGGAAIFNNGYNPAHLSLWNVTIAANESTIPAALTNSGVIDVMAHAILVENPGGDCNNSGSVSSEHHNMSSDPSGCAMMVDASDQVITDAKVLAPADSGGATETLALPADSPAIDAGGTCTSEGSPLLTDQRGWPRPVDGDVDGTATCDIGAFEASPPYQLWLPLIMR